MIKHVKKRFTSPLFADSNGSKTKKELLWGDRVRVIDDSGPLWKVKARGTIGWIKPGDLGNQSYLELYIIDVGQGDGVFIRTPDDKHILIDGGWPRKNQPTGKNAADFVDWKFIKDYERNKISLDAMICSHNDQDHYGGLWDLLDETQHFELDADNVEVENFYHAGLSYWKKPNGKDLGPSVTTPDGTMWTRLLEDRASLENGLKTSGTQPKFGGEWASFLRKVKNAKTAAGQPTPVTRLTNEIGSLPGFDDPNGVDIKVLGPVSFDVNGKPAIRKFSGGTSQNTNGNSVLLRLDFKHVRILLTGDLNLKSQRKLIDDYGNQAANAFKCDVAKSCHHGSADVSFEFLEKMEPACTIISSGDSEGHDHPRPNIIAASGLTGLKTLDGDKLVTPLIYSTELARSISLGRITHLDQRDANNTVVQTFTDAMMRKFRTRYKVTMAGDRNPKSGNKSVGSRRIAASTTYGLINVRTDGKKIMCAALNEKDQTWNVESFEARF